MVLDCSTMTIKLHIYIYNDFDNCSVTICDSPTIIVNNARFVNRRRLRFTVIHQNYALIGYLDRSCPMKQLRGSFRVAIIFLLLRI